MFSKALNVIISQSKSLLEWKWVFRFLLFSSFAVSLAFFLHFREVRVDQLELGSVAEKYVLAQVGFEFSDIEAAHVFKKEAQRDFGKMYCFDGDEVVAAKQKILEDLIKKDEWRVVIPEVTFDELAQACEDVNDILLNVGITDARTVSKLKTLPGPFRDYQMLTYVPEQLTGRLPDSVWDQIVGNKSSAFNYVWQKLRGFSWTMVEDLATQNAVRQLLKESAPKKMTKVEAGSRIINAGDRVTQRHLDMIKSMKNALSEQRFKMTPLTVTGSLTLSIIFTLMAIAYFKTFYPHLLQSVLKLTLVGAIIILTLSVAKIIEYFIINETGVAEFFRYPIFVLFATLTLTILIDKRVAMLISGFIAMILTVTLAIEYHHFLIINLSAAVMTLLLAKRVKKRKEIFAICAKVWVLTLPMIIAMNLLENSLWSYHLLADFVTTLISLSVTGLLILAFLPLFEVTFKVVTDMTLLETADSSHPLLRRLSLEAPGTYQHSLGVAALAEEAALAIHANGIFCRVAALFHDIGKLSQPYYFTENQTSGFNIHQLLTPLESAELIIAHVTEGVKLAKGHKLSDGIIDIIREHHGTTVVSYFLQAQKVQCRVNGIKLDEIKFQYPGPIPRSRESGIIMIADSVEAAFRSLDEVTEKSVSALVDSIVADKVRQLQFNESQLTFEEMDVIKKVIIRILIASSHSRVKYPAKEQEQVVENSEEITLTLS